MLFDKAGFGFHRLERLVALDYIGGDALPAFYLVQNGLCRRFVVHQLSDVILGDAPRLSPVGGKQRLSCKLQKFS
jgi:hypothetical protein